MGTNFYWQSVGEVTPPSSDDPKIHIGKRSAAGLYCWDCSITLCRYGEAGIHHFAIDCHDANRFHTECPRCGTKAQDERLDTGAVATELGFAAPHTARPTGVSSCASFTWAQHPDDVRTRIDKTEAEVIDEYGHVLSGQAFLAMLQHNCPVWFHLIGACFS